MQWRVLGVALVAVLLLCTTARVASTPDDMPLDDDSFLFADDPTELGFLQEEVQTERVDLDTQLDADMDAAEHELEDTAGGDEAPQPQKKEEEAPENDEADEEEGEESKPAAKEEGDQQAQKEEDQQAQKEEGEEEKPEPVKDHIDDMIDDFIDQVKKGNTAAFGGAKATVLSNSNVLTHKERNNNNFMAKLLRTKEESKKSQREDKKKQRAEETEKRLEEVSKKKVLGLKEKLRKEQIEEDKRQDKMQAQEEEAKSKEADNKSKFEEKTKQTVKKAREKAAEETKKAQKELDTQRKKEAKGKVKAEQKNKAEIKEAHKKAKKAREQAKKKQKQKQDAERAKKKAEKAAEKRKKDAARRKEESDKSRKRNAAGRWCSCTTQRIHFQQSNQWHNCQGGKLITGIYRGAHHNLANIFYYRCCTPCRDDGRTRLAVTACRTANWARTFDRTGWSYCPSNTYIQGFYKSSCNWIYCLEYARCCAIAGSRGRRGCGKKASWARSFDRQGWSSLDTNRFMIGLYRSGGHRLYNIEYANQCGYYAYS